MKVQLLIALLLPTISHSFAQGVERDKPKDFENSHRFTLLTGLIQPVLLGGVNVAGTYYTKRFTFEYSHGMFLHYPRLLQKDDNLTSLYSKWSTGAGIGYRLTTRRDLRLEIKAHNYDAKLIDGNQVDYTVYSLGIGFYSRKYLWQSNWLVEYSFRYWPNISSTLTDDKFEYTDDSGTSHTHKVHSLGFIFNVSLGYTFNKKSK